MIPLKADIVFWVCVCVVVLMFGISFDSDITIKKIFTKKLKLRMFDARFCVKTSNHPKKCLSET
jgi:hypothetical protein